MSRECTLIIIPTYSERENVLTLVQQILSVVPDSDILLVDDNSPEVEVSTDDVPLLTDHYAPVDTIAY